jgi:hypothetical protein
MSKAKSVQELAAELNAALVHQKRSDGKELVSLASGSPDWMQELCRKAHGDMMPDDWKYEFIEDAAVTFEEGNTDTSDLDSCYPYTADRLRWLASHLDRPGFCDEAASEFLPADKRPAVLELIAVGMYWEMDQVFGIVMQCLIEREQLLASEAAEASPCD